MFKLCREFSVSISPNFRKLNKKWFNKTFIMPKFYIYIRIIWICSESSMCSAIERKQEFEWFEFCSVCNTTMQYWTRRINLRENLHFIHYRSSLECVHDIENRYASEQKLQSQHNYRISAASYRMSGTMGSQSKLRFPCCSKKA